MAEISIIVPVYKVENYLVYCIESILNQTYKDFELILVDDGSPDRCGEICDSYAEKDKRIIVIHQNNQGLSGARNSGMDVSKGSYITFIDSDDIILPDYLNHLYLALKSENADISVCKAQEFMAINSIRDIFSSSRNVLPSKLYSNVEACIAIYNGNASLPINAWGKLFSRSLISSFRFPVGRLHEDQAIIPLICYRAKKIVALDQELYCYRQRDKSITKSMFTNKRYDDIWAINKCIKYFTYKEEKEILEAAKSKRKRLLCVYAIYAKRDRVKIPQRYAVSVFKALFYLRKNVSQDRYQYYLAQVSPIGARVYEYEIRLKSFFTIDLRKYFKKIFKLFLLKG